MTVVAVEHDDLLDALARDPLPMLPRTGAWTVDDLARLPDDGRRYELFDGVLVVSPAPFARHQRAVGGIFALLRGACPDHLETFVSPYDFQPTDRRSFQPDVLVVKRDDVNEGGALHAAPVLAVEVLSKSSRSLDRVFKRNMYATSGVEHYWIVDPEAVEVVHERDGDGYREVARAVGDAQVTVERPVRGEDLPGEIVKG